MIKALLKNGESGFRVKLRKPVRCHHFRISRTSLYTPNSDGYDAALKTIKILERDHVFDKIWEKGGRFLKKVQCIINKYDVGAELSGVAPMFFITFKRD